MHLHRKRQCPPLILPTLLMLAGMALGAPHPQLINYEGRIAAGGVNFDGSGHFKFALVDDAGTTSYWSNDGTSTAGSEPAAAAPLTVSKGQYTVLLGDASLPAMAAIPDGILDHPGRFLRVWFNDGVNGSQQLHPDQLITATAPGNSRKARDGRAETTGDFWQQRVVDPAPAGRQGHTAVWTGSEMIVWGGSNNNGGVNTGGRYSPAVNNWTALTTTDAPLARFGHTAVWTGSGMIVWGGFNSIPLNTGGRYDPALNLWTDLATKGAPSGRWYHTAAWTGRRMIVWGGLNAGGYLNSGALYDPVADDWTTVNQSGAPSPRLDHTAVWTNRGMVVWGGYNDTYLKDGGRYDPEVDTWTAVNFAGAPSSRGTHTAVWTGQDMIVWGGVYFDGSFHALNDGGRYNPADDTWVDINRTGAPAARHYHTAMWSGKEMIVWGGFGNAALNDGGRYDPAANLWTAVSSAGAPPARWLHTAVWTGRGMIVWGGVNGNINLNTGGHYDAAADRWTAMTPIGAPPARQWHPSLWTGSRMMVQGGLGGGSSGYFNDIFSYSPGYAAFQITNFASIGGNILLDFPSVTGYTYTLWHSDNLASGPWTGGGLPPLAGTGSTLTFTFAAPSHPRRFYRIKADP